MVGLLSPVLRISALQKGNRFAKESGGRDQIAKSMEIRDLGSLLKAKGAPRSASTNSASEEFLIAEFVEGLLDAA
jgi:hypothetical protein